jgi:hypothetical protein
MVLHGLFTRIFCGAVSLTRFSLQKGQNHFKECSDVLVVAKERKKCVRKCEGYKLMSPYFNVFTAS